MATGNWWAMTICLTACSIEEALPARLIGDATIQIRSIYPRCTPEQQPLAALAADDPPTESGALTSANK
jgi:hypothetical protein